MIPVIKDGKSVVGQSQTGSGKTHAFLLPIFDGIDPTNHEVQAVITTPSRELAYQIYEAAKQLTSHSSADIRVRTTLVERTSNGKSISCNMNNPKL